MTRRKLAKLKRDIEAARQSQVKAIALEKIAKALGRRSVKRGKEPVWENEELPNAYPIAIPRHGGQDISTGTKNNILDSLDDDYLAWEEKLDEDDQR